MSLHDQMTKLLEHGATKEEHEAQNETHAEALNKTGFWGKAAAGCMVRPIGRSGGVPVIGQQANRLKLLAAHYLLMRPVLRHSQVCFSGINFDSLQS